MPEIKLDDEKVLRMFVDRLIADKGGDTLDAKQKEILQKELFEELDERIQQAMIRTLTDAKLVELEKLLDEDAPDEEIESFFKRADADFDPAIRKAMDEFRTDYFKDKIRVSVKTSILEAAPEAKVAETTPAAGQPAQGTNSAVPGQSNVEGVANATSAVEQGQTPATQPQVVTQGANATSSVSATPSAVPGAAPVAPNANAVSGVEGMPSVTPLASATPVTPAASASAAPVNPVAQATTTVAPAVPVTPAVSAAPAAEQPLQAAPNLMDALNTATANLDAATASLNANPAVVTNSDVTSAAGAEMGATTNTDTTGKEA